MTPIEKYWKLTRVTITEIDRPPAQKHLESSYPEILNQDSPDHRALQRCLVQELRQAHLSAALCLRCYASYHIFLSCHRLVQAYGEHYGFNISNLAPITLDDDGEIAIEITYENQKLSIQRPAKYSNENGERYQPLTYRILEKFDPEKANLSTWSSRLTWQDAKLKKLLKDEYGILMISDWALLNDYQPLRLQRMLIKHFNFPNPDNPPNNLGQNAALAIQEIRSLIAIHKVYHAIYVAEHTPQRGKSCPEPTDDQCRRMMEKLDLTPLPPEEFRTEKLQPIADYIRRHRLKKLPPSLPPPQESSSPSIDPERLALFNHYLKAAVAKTLNIRLKGKKKKPAQIQELLQILHLQYREGLSQIQIAEHLGLPGQYTVNKRLDFTNLSIGFITHISEQIKNDESKLAAYFNDPDQLLELSDQIRAYVGLLINEDKRLRATPIQHRQQQQSQIGEAICDFLDRYQHH